MSDIITNLSTPKNWELRIGDNNQFTIAFLLSSVAYNISAYTFIFSIRKFGSDSNILQLTQGSGITNGGASGVLTCQVTKTNSELLAQSEYYWECAYTIGGLDYTLFNGTLKAVKQLSSGTPTTSMTVNVNLAGTALTANITLALSQQTRTETVASTTTLTPDPMAYDLFEITLQAEALTIENPSTDLSVNDAFVIRITDNGTARAISFGSKYRAFGSALPTTTTINKTMYISIIRNVTDDKYDVLPSQEEQ